MDGPRDLRSVIESAERAAAEGNYASAEQLLREAALLQETQLGRLHPDLANTLNNLGVVYEMTGRPAEAEDCYRRAFAIARAVLEPNHPFVETSGQNLRDLCESRGTPVETPGARPPVSEPPAAPEPARPQVAAPAAVEAPAAVHEEPPTVVLPPPPKRSPAIVADPRPLVPAEVPRETTPREHVAPARRSNRSMLIAAIVAVVLGIALLMAVRGWFGSKAGAGFAPNDVARPVEPSAAPPARAPAPSAATTPAPAPPEPAANPEAPAAGSSEPPAPATAKPFAAAGTLPIPALVEARVCANFAARGRDWQCETVSAETAPGTLFYYTRIKSPAQTVIRHRWFRGNRLHQDVELTVRANTGSGFRTYSRNTVIAPNAGEWRVELRGADGSLLDEQRFTVK
jgi:hypothetical protein